MRRRSGVPFQIPEPGPMPPVQVNPAGDVAVLTATYEGRAEIAVPLPEIDARGVDEPVNADEVATHLADAIEEAEAARQQLAQMKRMLLDERIARLELAEEAKRERQAMNAELAEAIRIANLPPPRQPRQYGVPLGLLGIGILGAGLVYSGGGPAMTALRSAWTTIQESPAQDRSPPAEQTNLARPRTGPPVRVAPATSEAAALDHLGEAMAPLPAPAIPSALRAVNQLLGARGQPACSVETVGGISIVIIPGEKSPLLTALTRCADAVEQFTSAPP